MEEYFRMKYFMDFVAPLVAVVLWIIAGVIVMIKAAIADRRRKHKEEHDEQKTENRF